MTAQTIAEHPPFNLTWADVFPSSLIDDTYLTIPEPQAAVTYFVGRNGTGKSRAARALARKAGGHLLSTDRLIGLMRFNSFEFGSVSTDYRGVPIAAENEDWARGQSREEGTATQELYALREQPDVALRVAAFIRRALGRVIELREASGFLDPTIRVGNVEYSLFRDEGHGLRELVVLLTALYREDWKLLVVDEPELHLHPSMVRLWTTELSRECEATGRRAIVVTHEPSLLRPKSYDDLDSILLFRANMTPIWVADAVLPVQQARVDASLSDNHSLIGLLAFSPRPVLVEGPTDVAALTVALRRVCEPEVVAQTDLVECGGSGAVSMWLEIARKLGLDVRAVTDLDACFASEVQRVMDADPAVQARYREEFYALPARTNVVLSALISEANKNDVAPDPKGRARWLASVEGVHLAKRNALLAIWQAAGLWVHPQGTLEDVLGIPPQEKGVPRARKAAETPGEIDRVAEWCAFELDAAGDLYLLLSVAVEGIAHRIMEAQRSTPGARFDAPVGGGPGIDRLVRVEPAGEDSHRITVLVPREFAGYSLVFSRETPSTGLILQVPDPEADGGTSGGIGDATAGPAHEERGAPEARS